MTKIRGLTQRKFWLLTPTQTEQRRPLSQLIFLSGVLPKGCAWKQSRCGRLILPHAPTENLKVAEIAATRVWMVNMKVVNRFPNSPPFPECFYSWTRDEETFLLAAFKKCRKGLIFSCYMCHVSAIDSLGPMAKATLRLWKIKWAPCRWTRCISFLPLWGRTSACWESKKDKAALDD